MRLTVKVAAVAASISMMAGVATDPASAACTRLGFSVNDYGKDGPTKDAKQLLDKYIAKKMADRGIKKYTTGKKDVTCELYLNLILFDEHTCKAEATVCWDGAPLPKGETAAAGSTDSAAKPAPKAAAKADEKASDATAKPVDAEKAEASKAEPVKTEAVKAAAPAADTAKPAAQ